MLQMQVQSESTTHTTEQIDAFVLESLGIFGGTIAKSGGLTLAAWFIHSSQGLSNCIELAPEDVEMAFQRLISSGRLKPIYDGHGDNRRLKSVQLLRTSGFILARPVPARPRQATAKASQEARLQRTGRKPQRRKERDPRWDGLHEVIFDATRAGDTHSRHRPRVSLTAG